jgi:hypothetical protein
MNDLTNLFRPTVLLALAGSAAVGFAAGYLLGRDPQLLRRLLAAGASAWEHSRLAVAEAREELADQWVEAREIARHSVEEAAFAAAATAAAPAPAAREAAAAPVRKAKRAPRAAAPRRSTVRATH